MTLYVETSAILRWLLNESQGAEILRILRSAPVVTTSRLTLIECRRAIRRAVVEARITEAEAALTRGLLAQAATRWSILEITPEVAERAEGQFLAEPVRSLDAIHLASALILFSAAPDLIVLSSDERVRMNATQLGLQVLPD